MCPQTEAAFSRLGLPPHRATWCIIYSSGAHLFLQAAWWLCGMAAPNHLIIAILRKVDSIIPPLGWWGNKSLHRTTASTQNSTQVCIISKPAHILPRRAMTEACLPRLTCVTSLHSSLVHRFTMHICVMLVPTLRLSLLQDPHENSTAPGNLFWLLSIFPLIQTQHHTDTVYHVTFYCLCFISLLIKFHSQT